MRAHRAIRPAEIFDDLERFGLIGDDGGKFGEVHPGNPYLRRII